MSVWRSVWYSTWTCWWIPLSFSSGALSIDRKNGFPKDLFLQEHIIAASSIFPCQRDQCPNFTWFWPVKFFFCHNYCFIKSLKYITCNLKHPDQWRDLNSWPFLTKEVLYHWLHRNKRAEDETRTRDPNLEGYALPTELFRLYVGEDSNLRSRQQQIYSLPLWPLWTSQILISTLKTCKSREDSNPRPADYKSAALANWATPAA